jgi:hypothetical protein
MRLAFTRIAMLLGTMMMLIFTCALLTGCADKMPTFQFTPQTVKAPANLMQTPAPLLTLSEGANMGDLLSTSAENNSRGNQCMVQLGLLQSWAREVGH